jgi:hypothetical protein
MNPDITPLPWKVREDKDSFAVGYMIENITGYPVANTMYFASDKDTNEMHKRWDKPNAEYICKAANLFPELVECLHQIIQHDHDENLFDEFNADGEDGIDVWSSHKLNEILSKARELLQKAK